MDFHDSMVSFGNTMMIFLQNPEATYVMGYKAWNKLGRYVRKGSKGLAILAPCIKKQRHYFANKGPSSQGYGFSCGHVWMSDCEEGRAPKN